MESIVNSIISNYLAEYLVINPEKTKLSLFEGTVELQGVKFKKTFFATLNLPYLELVEGYIGKIFIKLSLPRFYLYPIHVLVDKIYIKVKPKNMNKIKEEEILATFEIYKKKRLKQLEELMNVKLTSIFENKNEQNKTENKKEKLTMVENIINNLHVKIQNIVVIYEDCISNPIYPINLGITLNNILIDSTNKNFNYEQLSEEEKVSPLKYKKLSIENLNIFLDNINSEDIINNNGEINTKLKIKEETRKNLDEKEKIYLNDSIDFYLYCESEIQYYSKDSNYHSYLLRDLNPEIRLVINQNFYKENNKDPEMLGTIDIKTISVEVSNMQVKALTDAINYITLKNFYQKTIIDNHFNKVEKIDNDLIRNYLDLYSQYYKTKYIEVYKNEKENKKFIESMEKYEKNLKLESIQAIREMGNDIIQNMIELGKIDKEIKNADGGFWSFFKSKNNDEIEKLKLEREKKIKEQDELKLKNNTLNQFKDYFTGMLKNDESVKSKEDKTEFMFIFLMEKLNLVIKEQNKERKTKKIFEINFIKFESQLIIKTISQSIKFNLNDMQFSQYLSENKNYETILYSKNIDFDKKDEIISLISIEFEHNTKFPISPFKIKLHFGKQLFIIIDYYYLYYLYNLFLKHINAIDFNNLSVLVNEKITSIVKVGYENLVKNRIIEEEKEENNNKLFNLHVDISLTTPILLFPLNFRKANNKQMLYISLGILKIKSKLADTSNEQEIYDKYIIELSNFIMKTIDIYNTDEMIKDDVGEKIIYKSSFNIELQNYIFETQKKSHKTKEFSPLIVNINLNNIKLSLCEEQIIFLINYLENFLRTMNEFERVRLIKKENLNKKEKSEIPNKDNIPLSKNENQSIKNNSIFNKPSNIKENKTNNGEQNIEKKQSRKDESDSNILKLFIKFGNVQVFLIRNLTETKKINFLSFFFKESSLNLFLKLNNSINMDISFGHFYLYDKDQKINSSTKKEEDIINPEFKYIIGTTFFDFQTPKEKKIKLSDIYNNKYEKNSNTDTPGNESIKIVLNLDAITNQIDVNITMCKLTLSPNLSTISRIYKFIFKYIEIYNQSVYNLMFEKLKEEINDKNQNQNNFEGDSPAPVIIHTNLKENLVLDKDNTYKTREKSTINVMFTMEGINLLLPIEHDSNNTYIIFMSLEMPMNYIMKTDADLYFKDSKLIKRHYFMKKNQLSIYIKKGSFSIYEYKDDFILLNYKEKLMNDFEFSFFLDNSLDNKEKTNNNYIKIAFDRITEISLNINHVIILLGLYEKLNEFIKDINEKDINKLIPNKDQEIMNDEDFKRALSNSIINDREKQEKNEKLKRKEKELIDDINYTDIFTYDIIFSNFYIKFYDIIDGVYQSLFEFSMNDTKIELLQNFNPKDSTNLREYIKSTFSSNEQNKKRLDSYDKNNIFLYLKILTNIEVKLLNNYLNQWEYFIEPFQLEFYFSQLLKRMRPNIELFINNMININISLNFSKILRFAIKKFILKREELKKVKEETPYDNETITPDTPRYLGYESPLLIIENNSGVDMHIWFDNIKYENANNDSIIIIKSNDKYELTNNLLTKLNVLNPKRRNKNFNSTMSYKFCLDKKLIQELNINENNLIGNNFNINYHHMEIHSLSRLAKVSIESCSDNLLIRHIIFSSLISLNNESHYKDLEMYNNIEKINIGNKKKQNIPISWLLRKNNQILYLVNEGDEKIIFENMFNIEKMNKVIKFKNGKVIMIDIIKYKLNLDEYYLNNNISENKENIYRIDLIISSPINILNNTPYEFSINANEKIPSMKCLSSNINDPNLLVEYYQKMKRQFKYNSEIIMRIIKDIQLQILYNDKYILAHTYIYEEDIEEGKASNSFSIYNKSLSILLKNNNSQEFLICRLIFYNPYKSLQFDNKSYKEMQIELNSFRYEIIFDYYFVNKTSNNLYFNNKYIDIVKASKDNILIQAKKLLPISKILLKDSINLRKTQKDWTENFEFTALGKEFILNLKNENKTYNAISIMAEVSMIFKKSITFTMEDKFVVINELPFDIYIKEDKMNIIVKYKSKESNILLLNNETLEEKSSFRLGINNCFSHIFDPSKLGSYDLLIPYDQKTFEKYTIDSQNKLVEYDSKLYFPIRCIINNIKTNTIYILFSLSNQYINQLTNRTPKTIQVFIHDHKNKRFLVKPEKTIPLVYINHEDKYKPVENISIVFEGNIKTRVNINDIATKFLTKNKNYYIRIRPENNNSTKSITLFTKNDKRLLKDLSIKKRIKKYITSKGAKVLLNLEGIGLSFIDKTPKEIFYFSLYKIFLNYSFSSYQNILNEIKLYNSFTFSIKNVELDYCLDNAYEIVFNPTNQILPLKYEEKIEKAKKNKSIKEKDKVKEEDEETPFIQLVLSQKVIQEIVNNKKNVLYSIYPIVAFVVQEFDVRINTILINCFINLLNQYMQILFPESENINNIDMINLQKESNIMKDDNLNLKEISNTLLKKGEDRNMNQLIINYLTLSAIRANTTFKINKNAIEINFIPQLILTVLNILCSSLTSFSDVTIKLSELTFVNVFNDYDSLQMKLLTFYKNELLSQIYKIIFSMDLIGNPINLVEGLGTGIFEFFNEPRKGLLKGPAEFGLGIAKGTKALVSNIVGSGFKSASKITGSLLTASKNLSSFGTKEEEVIIKEEEKPRGFFSGTLSGIKKGFGEIKSGVTGIVTKPIEQSKKSGFGGFFKGLGSGLLGAVLTPVNTVLTVGNEVSSGISNSEFISNKKALRRFRLPRTLYRYVPIKPYDERAETERKNKRKEIEGKDKIVVFSLSNDSLCLENSTQLIMCTVLKDNYVLLLTDVMIKILDKECKTFIKKIYVCNIKSVVEKENNIILNMKNNEQELFLFSIQKDKKSFINEINNLIK